MKSENQIHQENTEKREAMSIDNIPENIHNILLGDIALRKNSGFPDEPQEWIEFEANETYMRLIVEFPEDYKRL